MDDPNKVVALGPWSTLTNDPDADGTVGWDAMDSVARATAVLAALRASFPVDTSAMRWDPSKRIGYASRPSVVDPVERRQVTMEHVPAGVTLEVVIAMIAAGHGRKAADDAAALAQPRKRWFSRRRK